MLPTKYWADMAWPDFQRVDMSRVIAVMPVAAIEQHGPHLPVGVDAVINQGYVERAAEQLPRDLPALFLPLQPAGVSGEHSDYPGTLSLSVESAIRAWTEIGDSVARAGCRKLVVMNSHGGNAPAIEAVTAPALADARNPCVMAATRLSRRPVLGTGDGARHSWGRCGNFLDAGFAS